MMKDFNPLRDIPKTAGWGKGDVMVVFGEMFSRGYVNGIVEEAERHGLKVIFSTVGRRDGTEGTLRPLNAAELAEKAQPLINIPLECGFDLTPARSGRSPADQLEGVKLSEWLETKLNWQEVEESRQLGVEDFCRRARLFLKELESHIQPNANVLFVHTMAGGVPRAKIAMPAMNRVFKGSGDRYASSKEFWQTDLGKLCALSFTEVTGLSFRHLIDLSHPIRERQEKHGRRVSYVAYGYHGTEVLMANEYQWQSYSPYLQGFAKIELEKVARKATEEGLNAAVFNAPEILTNSSSVFLGVEVSLYPLLGALRNEGQNSRACQLAIENCQRLLKPEVTIDAIMDYTRSYFQSNVMQRWSSFVDWPQHNGPEQMALMRSASTHLIDCHRDSKNLITALLSEVVFKACGGLMFREAYNPAQPVWWIGHDMIAKYSAQNQ